jgi:hypothetical protein
MLPSHALAYLHLYAQKFDLMKNIRLNAEIIKIKRAVNWEENGKFSGRNSKNDEFYRELANLVDGFG